MDATKYEIHSCVIACAHKGEHRDRSKGIRPNQHVMSCDCPFSFRVAFESKFTNKYVIARVDSLNHNHLISAAAIKDYRVKE